METIKRIWGPSIIGAIFGAIIAVAICLWDTVPYDSVWGDVVYRPANTNLIDILPEWMLIGAVAVNLSVWMTGNNR